MKSRFICVVSSPNLWEDHHHLILSLRPVMGIQRAGYQTVQSAGKIQNVPLAHLELAVAAEGEQWLLAGGQITGRDASGLHSLHPGFSSFRSSSLFICLFIIFSIMCAVLHFNSTFYFFFVSTASAYYHTVLDPRPTSLCRFLSLAGNRPQDTSSVSFTLLSAAPNFY